MAHSLTALKRHRQNLKHRIVNRQVRSRIRTEMKRLLTSIAEKKTEEAKTGLRAITQLLDKAALSGVIHKNNASRYKSRLAKKVSALGKTS